MRSSIEGVGRLSDLAVASQIIKKFDMKPLPEEGGYFIETYRSSGPGNSSTSILYLITEDNFSKLHKLSADEIYHFYLGDPVIMLNLYENGLSEHIVLGKDILNGEKCQHAVPGNCWQGSFLKEGGVFALLGVTMTPAFQSGQYRPASTYKKELLEKYPGMSDFITKLI
jgi:uncharacterized protein